MQLTDPTRAGVDYEKYLRSDAWKAKRNEALGRAERLCQLCGSSRDLQVHHRTYANLGRERPADLTVLCGRCHQWHHWRLMMIDAPYVAYDPIKEVQHGLRLWSEGASLARGDLAELASAKAQALDRCRHAFRLLDGIPDLDPNARAWLRRCLVAQIADGLGYSQRMVERLFALDREAVAT